MCFYTLQLRFITAINKPLPVLFTWQEVQVDKESQSRGSVAALILVIFVAFALVNFDKVWMHTHVQLLPICMPNLCSQFCVTTMLCPSCAQRATAQSVVVYLPFPYHPSCAQDAAVYLLCPSCVQDAVTWCVYLHCSSQGAVFVVCMHPLSNMFYSPFL
jgi:hypothetical protein